MSIRIDRAQQKRRLILSPILCAFMGLLGYLTAPNLLVFGIATATGLLLIPVIAFLIDMSEQGRSHASTWIGGIGALVGVAILRALMPDGDARHLFMFALAMFGFALGAGLGQRAWAMISIGATMLRSSAASTWDIFCAAVAPMSRWSPSCG